MTVWPRRSIVVVAGPASFLIAALVPTAVKRPPEIAIASAIENRASTVMTWPLTRIVSARRRRLCRADDDEGNSETAESAEPRPSLRACVLSG